MQYPKYPTLGIVRAIGLRYSGGMDTSTIQPRREALGLSRRQFAAILGVDQASVWRWEAAGKKPIPLMRRQIEATLSRLESEQAKGLAS